MQGVGNCPSSKAPVTASLQILTVSWWLFLMFNWVMRKLQTETLWPSHFKSKTLQGAAPSSHPLKERNSLLISKQCARRSRAMSLGPFSELRLLYLPASPTSFRLALARFSSPTFMTSSRWTPHLHGPLQLGPHVSALLPARFLSQACFQVHHAQVNTEHGKALEGPQFILLTLPFLWSPQGDIGFKKKIYV